MNDRTCIVTRKQAEPDELIRFVVGPIWPSFPIIKRNLPGRGCWVSADRLSIPTRRRRRNLFARAFKAYRWCVPPDLGGGMVDGLFSASALA